MKTKESATSRDSSGFGRVVLHFAPGSSGELADRCFGHGIIPGEMQQMGVAARAEYEANYTAEKNYKMLTNIYQSVRRKITADGERHFLRTGSPHAQRAREV